MGGGDFELLLLHHSRAFHNLKTGEEFLSPKGPVQGYNI